MQLHLDKKHRVLCNIPSIMPVRYNVLIPMHCERLASRNSQKMRMDFVPIYDERFTHYCIGYYCTCINFAVTLVTKYSILQKHVYHTLIYNDTLQHTSIDHQML